LTFTYNLARQILKRNIPLLQGVIRVMSKGSVPVTSFNHFIEMCQNHEIDGAVKYISEQLDSVTKTFVAFMSETKKTGR
jgi:hypothetical protein